MRRVHAYLLLLPAFVLLVAFTHYPAVATLIDSFYSTPRGSRPAIWVGLENYQVMVNAVINAVRMVDHIILFPSVDPHKIG